MKEFKEKELEEEADGIKIRMDITELCMTRRICTHRWRTDGENFGSLDGIIDTDDPFTLQGAPRFELTEDRSLLHNALTDDENLAD